MTNDRNTMVTYIEIVDALKAILKCAETNGYLDDYSFLNAKYDIPETSPLHKKQEQALVQAIQSLEKTIDAADKMIRENLQNTLDDMKNSDVFTISTRYQQNEECRKLAAQEEFVTTLQEMSLPLEILSDYSDLEYEFLVEDSKDGLGTLNEEETIDSSDYFASDEGEFYYSRVKLGNPKTAFAVTEEQYQLLKQNDEEIDYELPSELLSETEEDDSNILDGPIASFELEVESPKNVSIKKEEIHSDEIIIEPQRVVVSDEKRKSSFNKIQLIKKALEKAQEKGNEQLIQILEHQLQKEIETLNL